MFHACAGDDGTLTKAYLAALKAVIAAEFAVLELRFTKELSLLRAEAGVRWMDTAIGFSILATAVLILWPWQSTRDDQAP